MMIRTKVGVIVRRRQKIRSEKPETVDKIQQRRTHFRKRKKRTHDCQGFYFLELIFFEYYIDIFNVFLRESSFTCQKFQSFSSKNQ